MSKKGQRQMWDIIFWVWMVGWVVAVYPIYRTALRLFTISSNTHRFGEGIRTQNKAAGWDDAAWSVVISTVGGLCWPLLLPYVLSRFVWGHGRMDLNADREAATVELNTKNELKQRMAAAMKELNPEADETKSADKLSQEYDELMERLRASSIKRI